MSFKRNRPLSYGNYKDQIITVNGVSQPSPLDKKQKPLEQQSKWLFAVSSDDRNQAAAGSRGEDIQSTDCVINLVSPIRGVYGYRVIEFTFTNRFYSCQTGLNDLLAVTYAVNPATGNANVDAGKIILDEGYYDFTSVPSEWTNPLDPVPLRNLNDINIGDYADYNTFYPNDVRVRLMGAALNPATPAFGAITRIVTDRKTDKITITWKAGVVPTLDTKTTTAISLLGLSRNSTGATWVSLGPPNIDGPTNLALSSIILDNPKLADPKGQNDNFLVVPIQAPEGSRQLYAPFFPPMVDLGTQQAITTLPIKIIEPESGTVLKANNMEWLLLIEFYSLDPSPFY